MRGGWRVPGVRVPPAGLAVTLCSRRERQEQLMGYRKRGPKPKPLVVQVTRAPSPRAPHPRAPCRGPSPGSPCSGFHHAEEPPRPQGPQR